MEPITVETTIAAPIDKVWDHFTTPEHITQWYLASDEWHAPHAENDLQVGSSFKITMAAKDDSFGFDFEGKYTQVVPQKLIAYELGDSRKVSTTFNGDATTTTVTQVFDPETQNPIEMQKGGWQAILDNLKNIRKRIRNFFVLLSPQGLSTEDPAYANALTTDIS